MPPLPDEDKTFSGSLVLMTSHAHYYYEKKVDRPNTTPVGQDRASQWRDVLFDPNWFEARPRNFEFLRRHFFLISRHSMDNLQCGTILM